MGCSGRSFGSYVVPHAVYDVPRDCLNVPTLAATLRTNATFYVCRDVCIVVFYDNRCTKITDFWIQRQNIPEETWWDEGFSCGVHE